MHFLLSERNKLVVGVIASWLAIHLLLLRSWPAFSQGPPGPAHSTAKFAFTLEGLGHVAVLGMVLTAIQRRISWWKTPTYGDDSLLSIGGQDTHLQPRYEVTPSNWEQVGWIVVECLVYGVVWLTVLKHSWSR